MITLKNEKLETAKKLNKFQKCDPSGTFTILKHFKKLKEFGKINI